jgi:hypothetical protein
MTGLLAALILAAHFEAHTIATGLKGGYQVVIADLNHDGKPDLIALASDMDELVWFENPGWQRHVIARGFHRMINCAARDIGSDGIPEIVLASGFTGPGQAATQVVTVLTHNGDPRGLWTAKEIDRGTLSHRLRWADVSGNGKPVVVSLPLTAPNATASGFSGTVPIYLYAPETWKREAIPVEDHGLVHGLYILDWDGSGRDSILTAAFDGIHLFSLNKSGTWTRTQISDVNTSDVAVGELGKDRFLAAIEPWHGNRVAVYRGHEDSWKREQIDDSLNDGHTILTADLDGDGRDWIVAGFRGGKQSVYLYKFEKDHWVREILDDGGIAAAACAVGDLNGDGRPDIACIGSATANLKWYQNSR